MLLEVLLVEDSPGDVRLTQEAFRGANASIRLHVATDGVEAMAFLRHEGVHIDAPRPDLILLDLNLPKMDGREVLAHIKEDEGLKSIPTVILTTSDAEKDIVKSYQLHANCYLSKPVQLDAFENLVKNINSHWLTQPNEQHDESLSVRLQTEQRVVPSFHSIRRREELKEKGKGMPLQVLLVEDSPGDIRLTREAFQDANAHIHLHVAADGMEAIAFLVHKGVHVNAPRPDLILLDLNLPKMDGREVLAYIKNDASLSLIPTVILTTSDAAADIFKSYQLQANCYLTKPSQLEAFEGLVRSINDFWLTKAKLPPQAQGK